MDLKMVPKLPNFKCIVIGDAHIGKTALIKKVTSSLDQDNDSIPQASHPIIFTTNFGSIILDIHDPNGQEISGNINDAFFKNARCAMIMFDLTSPSSYDNVFHWHRRVVAKCGKIPMVLCGNNSHAKALKVTTEKIKQDWKMKYFEMSLRNESTLHEPFIYLAQKLLKRGTLVEIAKIESESQVKVKSLVKLISSNADKNDDD